jgi:hypothetical protein
MQINYAVLVRFSTLVPKGGSKTQIHYADPTCGSTWRIHTTDPIAELHCGSKMRIHKTELLCRFNAVLNCSSQLWIILRIRDAEPKTNTRSTRKLVFMRIWNYNTTSSTPQAKNQHQIHKKTGFHADLGLQSNSYHHTNQKPIPDPHENWFSCGSGTTI